MKKNDELVIVCCPPYPEYQQSPPDQSQSELIDCPLCKNKMWFSEKKKGIATFASSLNKDIFLSCYNCFKEFIEKNKSLFENKEIKGIKI